MESYNINEAKARLSMLVARALRGEEIVISRAGDPLVRLVPYLRGGKKRRGGQWDGLVRLSEDFDDPLPEEVLKGFRGESE